MGRDPKYNYKSRCIYHIAIGKVPVRSSAGSEGAGATVGNSLQSRRDHRISDTGIYKNTPDKRKIKVFLSIV